MGTARRVALLGLALVLLGGGLALTARRRDEDEAAAARWAHLIVPVAARPESPDATDVGSLDALARIAEHHGRLILQAGEGDERTYLVRDGGSAYRFRPRRARPEPVPAPAPNVHRLPAPEPARRRG